MSATASETRFLSIGHAARVLAVLEWQLRALLRRRPELPHILIGRNRGLAEADLPLIRAALVTQGYLPPLEEGASRAS